MIIDEYGRIVDRTPTFVRTTLVGTITPRDDATFYERRGNVFSMASFLVSLVSLIAYLVISAVKKVYRKTPGSGAEQPVS